MTTSVRIEPAHPADPRAQLLIDVLSEELAAQYGERDPKQGRSDYVADAFDPATDVFVLAIVDGAAVGCGAVRYFDDGVGEIKRMFVSRAARGRGVGGAVLTALERAARQRGYDRLVLETGDEQHAAIRLYERAGYRPAPCWPPYDTRDFSRCYEKLLDLSATPSSH